jgi:hypothetical protein
LTDRRSYGQAFSPAADMGVGRPTLGERVMKKVFAAVILLSVASSVSGCATAKNMWGKVTGSSTASAASPSTPATGGADAAATKK